MRVVAPLLFAAVLFAHYGYPYLSGISGISEKGWFYIGQSTLIMMLSAMLFPVLWAAKNTLETRLAMAACVVAILESIQIPPCRLLIGPHLSNVPVGVNLCDHLTGLPVTSVMYGVEFFLVLAIVFAKRRKRT